MGHLYPLAEYVERLGDFFFEIRKGRIPGHRMVNIQGHAPDLSTDERTIWDDNSIADTTLLTTAATVRFASTNANDTSDGSGARTMLVLGLDSNGDEQSETITLNGQTFVTSSKTYSAINGMAVLTAGSSARNEGIIWCGSGSFTAGVPQTDKYFMIEDEDCIGKSASYTVPAGKELFPKVITILVAGTNKTVDADVHTKTSGLNRELVHLPFNAGSHTSPIDSAPAVEAANTVYLEADVSTGTADVSMVLAAILVDL